jgi:hypothetical protein
MIRSLTIIANEKEDGKVEYMFNGNLALEESVRAIVLYALQQDPKKKDDVDGSNQS